MIIDNHFHRIISNFGYRLRALAIVVRKTCEWQRTQFLRLSIFCLINHPKMCPIEEDDIVNSVLLITPCIISVEWKYSDLTGNACQSLWTCCYGKFYLLSVNSWWGGLFLVFCETLQDSLWTNYGISRFGQYYFKRWYLNSERWLFWGNIIGKQEGNV